MITMMIVSIALMIIAGPGIVLYVIIKLGKSQKLIDYYEFEATAAQEKALFAKERLSDTKKSLADCEMKKEQVRKSRDYWHNAYAELVPSLKNAEQKIALLLAESEQHRYNGFSHCSQCGRFLPIDSSLHIQTPTGPICGRCWEKLNRKER